MSMVPSLDILIVDDNQEVLFTMGEMLTLQGQQVRPFSDGAAAVADFDRRAADLVITDLGMPEVTGWEVARAIRALSPTTPIVFITAVGEPVNEAALRDLGILAVLRKPFRMSQLTALLPERPASPASPCKSD